MKIPKIQVKEQDQTIPLLVNLDCASDLFGYVAQSEKLLTPVGAPPALPLPVHSFLGAGPIQPKPSPYPNDTASDPNQHNWLEKPQAVRVISNPAGPEGPL